MYNKDVLLYNKKVTLINEIDYKEKRSEFIALLYKVENITDANGIISSLKKKHHKARHVLSCLNLDDSFIIKEDGEPIKAMHILFDEMKRKEIKNYLLCIVRYYGGINLGQNRLSKVYYELGNKLLNQIDTNSK